MNVNHDTTMKLEINNDDIDFDNDDIDINNDECKEAVCLECEERPCLFLVHQESLMAFEQAEHASLALENQPPNNIRQKKLYRQLTLMINGGPLGAGIRRALPDCCVSAIREMMPSETFMGFRAE